MCIAAREREQGRARSIFRKIQMGLTSNISRMELEDPTIIFMSSFFLRLISFGLLACNKSKKAIQVVLRRTSRPKGRPSRSIKFLTLRLKRQLTISPSVRRYGGRSCIVNKSSVCANLAMSTIPWLCLPLPNIYIFSNSFYRMPLEMVIENPEAAERHSSSYYTSRSVKTISAVENRRG